MLRKLGFVALTLLATLGIDPVRADFVGTMIGGHVDIGVAFDGIGLEPHIHKHDEADLTLFGGTILTGDQEFAPADLWFGVRAGRTNIDGSEDATFRRPAGAEWDFLGVAENDEIWVLPIVEQTNRPFVGVSAEELAGFSAVTVTINAITARNGIGNSTFSVFKIDGNGQPDWASSTGVAITDRQFTIPRATHDHFFMAFTDEGVFDVSLNFAATRTLDDVLFNSDATFTFAVGESNFAAVPEPTSMALLACCGTVMIGVRKWRKKSKVA
ncbi:MAG: choice-of-anchor M domain-containing protein [Pirellula sp.]|jgi:hypothetical protein